MRQRGSIIVYGVIALFVAAAGTTFVLTYKSAITRAEKAEAQLAECSTKYDQALASIATQNEAIGKWEKTAQEAQDRAKAALAKARAAQGATQSERARLKKLQAEFKPGICPAGQAVQEVRKGLRP